MAKGVYVWEQGSVGKEAVWSTLQIIMYYTEQAVQVSDVYVCMYVCNLLSLCLHDLQVVRNWDRPRDPREERRYQYGH